MNTPDTKIPQISNLLCETCGYSLTGLPETANCPECGHPISESLPIHRFPPAWEGSRNIVFRFFSTTAQVLFSPRRFYRTMVSRSPRRKSLGFAMLHWLLASLLFGWAAEVHINGFIYSDLPVINTLGHYAPLAILIFGAITFAIFAVAMPIASRLTAWEANYRGYRLPLAVVQRCLDYHAADYLPVALTSCLTIVGYRWLIDHRYLNSTFDAKYLYLLCGEVIAAAAFTFNAYWIGMRNVMYANA